MAGRILVVDAGSEARVRLKARLISGGFTVAGCATPRQAGAMIRDERPDVIVVTGDLARIAPLVAMGSTDEGLPPIPVVSIGLGGNPALRLAALEDGAAEVFDHDVADALLQSRLRALMRQRGTMPPPRRPFGGGAGLPGFFEARGTFEGPPRIRLLSEDADLADRLRRAAGARIVARDEGAEVVVLDMRHHWPRQAVAALHAASEGHLGCPLVAVVPRDNPVLTASLFDAGLADAFHEAAADREIALRLRRARSERVCPPTEGAA